MKNLPLKTWYLPLACIGVGFAICWTVIRHTSNQSASPAVTSKPSVSNIFSMSTSLDRSEAEHITEIFGNGIRLVSTTNEEDSDLYGAMLIENALERMIHCPDAVKDVWTLQLAHIERAEAPLRYVQIELFLEYLDRALVQCIEQSDMQNVWHIRRGIVKERDKARHEIVEKTKVVLESNLAEIERLKTALKTEKERDASPDGANNFEPKKEGDTWKVGPYQNILHDIVKIRESLESPDISPWLEFVDEERFANIGEQIAEIAAEASRLQGIRYNIWANRILFQQTEADPAVALDQISRIDTGLLLPSVYSLYSEIEQKKSSAITNAAQRTHSIRLSLLSAKIGRHAF